MLIGVYSVSSGSQAEGKTETSFIAVFRFRMAWITQYGGLFFLHLILYTSPFYAFLDVECDERIGNSNF